MKLSFITKVHRKLGRSKPTLLLSVLITVVLFSQMYSFYYFMDYRSVLNLDKHDPHRFHIERGDSRGLFSGHLTQHQSIVQIRERTNSKGAPNYWGTYTVCNGTSNQILSYVGNIASAISTKTPILIPDAYILNGAQDSSENVTPSNR